MQWVDDKFSPEGFWFRITVRYHSPDPATLEPSREAEYEIVSKVCASSFEFAKRVRILQIYYPRTECTTQCLTRNLPAPTKYGSKLEQEIQSMPDQPRRVVSERSDFAR